jgi:CHAT domain-containing protein/Tfp pilus assembly protein PilF
MDNEGDILRTLKYGSKEEKGRALINLSRLKDPASIETLNAIKDSGDPYLSVMAAYALGETGDKKGFQFLENLFRGASEILARSGKSIDLKILEEVLKLPDDINSALDLYNSSYFAESKEKLLKILEIYSSTPPKMNVPHFDDLIVLSMKKTKGLLLDAVAVTELYLGNVDSALQYSLEAITLAQEVGDPQLLKIALADLGYIHMFLGNYYRALELLHESLDIDKDSHDPWRKRNRILSKLSQLYYLVSQYERSMEYIQEALELSEKEKDLNGKARCLNAKGVLLCSLSEFKDAEESLLSALSLSVNELNDKTLQGLILTNLSYVHYSLSNLDKAREYLENALDLSIQMSDKSNEGTIMINMAFLELETGDDVDKAREYAETALDIGIQTYNLSGQADAGYVLGSIEDYWYENPEDAYKHYKESISISETLRKNLILDDFKISFAENYISSYQQITSLCIQTGKIEEAFEYIEKSKSRTLVDMLCNAVNEISSKKVSNEILEEISMLKGKLDILRKKLNSAHSHLSNKTIDLNDSRKSQINTDILEEITSLENSYKKTYEELKIKDPEWVSLMSVDVAGLKTVQSMLDKDTLLLEFYQINNEIIILSVRKDKSPAVHRIPIDIEKDSERLYNLFLALSQGKGLDSRSHDYIKYIKQPLSYFYDLLISPVLEESSDVNHLIIVPHFFWHYLPFHALYDRESKEHLIDKFSISYAPSATTLYYCLNKKSNGYESALILANPSNDLPFAEEEAEKVSNRFNDNVNHFNGREASFDKISDYSESDIIHLASHGYFRGDEPLFSYLIFAGEHAGESYLYLPDLFNLRLKTSLVTLSGCETGLSQFTSGDELIGMSRAFFYAGTPSLLASHWTVNDKSTALLMDKFYEGIVTRGMSKAEALKFAVQKLKAYPEYNHPYFWAPFFLSGDWR